MQTHTPAPAQHMQSHQTIFESTAFQAAFKASHHLTLSPEGACSECGDDFSCMDCQLAFHKASEATGLLECNKWCPVCNEEAWDWY